MNVGIAVHCGGVGHNQLAHALDHLSRYGVQPYAYCVSLGTLSHLLTHLTEIPEPLLLHPLKRGKIHTFADIPVPTAVCGRDFLSNEDIIFGEGFEPCRLKKLLRYHDRFPLMLERGKIITGRHVKQNTMLLALDQMSCDQTIILCNDHTVRKDTPRRLYWNISASERDYCDRSRMLDFLYFTIS